MAIITVDNVTKTYKTYKRDSDIKSTFKSFFKRDEVFVNAVENVSFEINEGDICGIMGPNGAGKSTIIKMLCGALFSSSGNIDVMGYSPAKDRKKYVSQIGAVFGQKSQLIWDIPPVDSFNMNKAIYGIDETEYKETLEELSGLLDVNDIIKKPTRVLSLGERMKCEFIMAMLHNPKIVFLDEPTIGLDVIAKSKIRDYIRTINKKGTSIILTTHDLEDVEQLASRVIIINHGRKVFDNSLSKLKNNLGEKKQITFKLLQPFDTKFPFYAKVIEQSDNELSIEVDVNGRSIGDIISEISKKVSFSDISISELPMEKIITNIYEHD